MTGRKESVLAEGDVYREHGYLQVQDGTRLAYVVWRPSEEGRYPVLLVYSVYGDSGMSFERARHYLDAGYAVVGADARGTGCSEGNAAPFGPHEGPDGAEIVHWAGVQPWSTGNVGMAGTSNPSNMQWLVAAEQPPHLKALCIAGGSTSNYRDVFYQGGMFQEYYTGHWALVSQQQSGRDGAERRIKEWGDKEGEQILASRKPHDFYYQVRQHPLQDEWWEQNGPSKEHLAHLITIPTMLIAGFQDLDPSPATPGRAFAHLLPNVEHKKLVYTNGGHHAVDLAPVAAERMRWMDHWLKGEDNGVDSEPPVTVFWETQIPGSDFAQNYDLPADQLIHAKTGWATTYSAWPVPHLQRTPLYLTGDAKLSPTQPAPGAEQVTRSYIYPTGTELIGSNIHFATAPAPSGSLNYRTDPMAADTALLGNPEASFHFSSEGTDTDFMVTLKDIDPDGNTLYLSHGYLRASMRAIDPARTWPDEITQSYRQVEKLEPGEIYELRFSLKTIGHVVRQGHRLEMSILAPNQIPSPALGSTPIGGPSVNNVYHSLEFPSKLVLPIVPGEKAQAPAPACGTLWNQPCRKAPASQDNWQGGFTR